MRESDLFYSRPDQDELQQIQVLLQTSLNGKITATLHLLPLCLYPTEMNYILTVKSDIQQNNKTILLKRKLLMMNNAFFNVLPLPKQKIIVE